MIKDLGHVLVEFGERHASTASGNFPFIFCMVLSSCTLTFVFQRQHICWYRCLDAGDCLVDNFKWGGTCWRLVSLRIFSDQVHCIICCNPFDFFDTTLLLHRVLVSHRDEQL
ncbi:hypothetical protein DL95DRAFT_379545, partial [Leptodontidium sp. 2 PMI_412]